MLIREDAESLVVVTQPVHSWVSGQFARLWGNERFGHLGRREEICLATELHDIGFLEWERAPTYNAARRRPHDFMDLPFGPHLELWQHGVEQMLALGRYPALLVSLHVSALCRNHMRPETPDQAQQMDRFLGDQQTLQTRFLNELREDPELAPFSTPAAVEGTRQLLSVWDELSLLAVLADRGTLLVEGVPTPAGPVCLRLNVDKPGRLRVSPWPFSVSQVTVSCEARRIARQFGGEAEMRAQLSAALPFSLLLWLSPEPS